MKSGKGRRRWRKSYLERGKLPEPVNVRPLADLGRAEVEALQLREHRPRLLRHRVQGTLRQREELQRGAERPHPTGHSAQVRQRVAAEVQLLQPAVRKPVLRARRVLQAVGAQVELLQVGHPAQEEVGRAPVHPVAVQHQLPHLQRLLDHPQGGGVQLFWVDVLAQQVVGQVEELQPGEHLEEEEDLRPLRQQVVRQVQLGDVGQSADADAAGADGLDVVVAEGHDRREHPLLALRRVGHEDDEAGVVLVVVGVLLLYGGEHRRARHGGDRCGSQLGMGGNGSGLLPEWHTIDDCGHKGGGRRPQPPLFDRIVLALPSPFSSFSSGLTRRRRRRRRLVSGVASGD